MSDIDKHVKYALAYGAGEKVVQKIWGRRILSGEYRGETEPLRGERALILTRHKTRRFENDTDPHILVQWDNRHIGGSHSWNLFDSADFTNLTYKEFDDV